MLFFGETDMRGGKARQREREARSSGGKKRDALQPYECCSTPSPTHTHTHTHKHTYAYTPQPTSRLYVSFGLEVGNGGGLHILLSPA